MKRILLIATGGTIASKQGKGHSGLTPVLTSQELLSYVPVVSQFCTTDTLQLINIDSTNMQPKHWLLISKAVEEHYNDYDGFVICHGTDTMAYTAAALSYLIQNSPKPIVITGAQKPIDLEITDAKTNLIDSIRFACHDKAYGVTLVFDGKAVAGTRAKKERTKSYNAFSSINFPYLASIQDDHILFYLDDKALLQGPVRFYHELDERIALVKLIPSSQAEILSYIANRCDAVIIESFGVGGLPTYDSGDFQKAVHTLVKEGKVVVMTTQVTWEGSNMSIYEVGKNIKQELGLIEAYDMTLEATVTKLMWILGQTKDAQKIRELFYTTINRDILWH